VEPTLITVACADGGIGVEKLVWTSWTQSNAVGNGEVWENDCTPDCASGTTHTYPATMSLSDVETTTSGRLFTQLAIVYRGTGPDGHTSDQFSLPLPPE
jgi:hypothetical protein